MADSEINSNIFGENFSSFALALKEIKSLNKLIAPVQEHTCSEKKIYTITPQTVNSEPIFPLFTDINSIEPPLLQKESLDFLKLIFSNPTIQTILINPPLEKPKPETSIGKTIKLNRNKLSMLIGSFQTKAQNADSEDFLKNIITEMNKGNLHSANYLSGLAIEKEKAQAIAAIYPQILINLRLYQDAYDFIKVFPQNPLMLYYSAVIFRVTGNFKKTSELLHSIAENVGMENKKNLQKAWIDMSLGNFKEAEDKFKQLLNSPLEKNEASIGLGMTLSKRGLLEKDLQALNSSLDIFKKSLDLPGGLNAQAHFYIGNIYFNTAKYPEALDYYEKSYNATPSLPTMINLTNTYLKLAKYEEALNMTLLIALVDLNAAEKILPEFPKDILSQSNTVHPNISTIQNMSQYANIFNISKPKEKTETTKNDLNSKPPKPLSIEGFTHEVSMPASPETPIEKSPETEELKISLKTKNEQFLKQIKSAKPTPANHLQPKEEPKEDLPEEKEESVSTASLERNEPIAQSNRIAPEEEAVNPASLERKEPIAQSDRIAPEEESDSMRMASLERIEPIAQSDRIEPNQETLSSEVKEELKMESSSNIFSSNIQNNHQANNEKDEFMARAFKLASQLENDFGKKVHFNINGITEIEKKLRLAFIGDHLDHQQKLNLVLDCAAFLCYMLKEKHKGKLIKFSDFDPWAWPMLFENSEMVTYPIERLWRLISFEKIPDAGWLIRYTQYLDGVFQTNNLPQYTGAKAVKNKVRSHPEKIIDAENEHKKILILNSSLEETRSIKIGKAGISELENSIKIRFKPQVPPTSEGWKLLRCYAHIFTEILIKELGVQWFNTDGNDGQWSMNTPWMTFIFPLGKVYKSAANGESLMDYFENLLMEKDQHT